MMWPVRLGMGEVDRQDFAIIHYYFHAILHKGKKKKNHGSIEIFPNWDARAEFPHFQMLCQNCSSLRAGTHAYLWEQMKE